MAREGIEPVLPTDQRTQPVMAASQVDRRTVAKEHLRARASTSASGSKRSTRAARTRRPCPAPLAGAHVGHRDLDAGCDGATPWLCDDHGQQLRRSDPVLRLMPQTPAPTHQRPRPHPVAHRHRPIDAPAPSPKPSASRTTERAALPCANARPTAGAAQGVHSGTVTRQRRFGVQTSCASFESACCKVRRTLRVHARGDADLPVRAESNWADRATVRVSRQSAASERVLASRRRGAARLPRRPVHITAPSGRVGLRSSTRREIGEA